MFECGDSKREKKRRKWIGNEKGVTSEKTVREDLIEQVTCE